MKLDWYKRLKEELEKEYIETDLEFDYQILEKILNDVEDRLPREIRDRDQLTTAIYLYSEGILDRKFMKSFLYKSALLNSRDIQYTSVRDSIDSMIDYISSLTSFEKDFIRNEIEKFVSIPENIKNTIDSRILTYVKEYIKNSSSDWSIPFLYYHNPEVESSIDDRLETIEKKLENFFQKRFHREFDNSLFNSINREIFRGVVDLDSLSRFKKFYEEEFDNSEIALLLDIQSKAFKEKSLKYIELDENIRDVISKINYSYIEENDSSILNILSEVRDSQLLELLYNIEDRFIYDIEREADIDVDIDRTDIDVDSTSIDTYNNTTELENSTEEEKEDRQLDIETEYSINRTANTDTTDDELQGDSLYDEQYPVEDRDRNSSSLLFTLLPNIKNDRNRVDLLRLKHLFSKYDIDPSSMSIEEILEKSEELYMKYENGDRNSDYLKIYYSISSLVSPELATLSEQAEEVVTTADIDSSFDGVVGFNLIKSMVDRLKNSINLKELRNSIYRNFREDSSNILHNLVEQKGILLYDRLTESFLVVDSSFSEKIEVDDSNSYMRLMNLIYMNSSRQFERQVIEAGLRSLHTFDNRGDELINRNSSMFTIPDIPLDNISYSNSISNNLARNLADRNINSNPDIKQTESIKIDNTQQNIEDSSIHLEEIEDDIVGYSRSRTETEDKGIYDNNSEENVNDRSEYSKVEREEGYNDNRPEDIENSSEDFRYRIRKDDNKYRDRKDDNRLEENISVEFNDRLKDSSVLDNRLNLVDITNNIQEIIEALQKLRDSISKRNNTNSEVYNKLDNTINNVDSYFNQLISLTDEYSNQYSSNSIEFDTTTDFITRHLDNFPEIEKSLKQIKNIVVKDKDDSFEYTQFKSINNAIESIKSLYSEYRDYIVEREFNKNSIDKITINQLKESSIDNIAHGVDDNIVDSKIENNRNENSVDKLDNRQQIEDIDKLDKKIDTTQQIEDIDTVDKKIDTTQQIEDIDKLDNIQLEDSSIDNIAHGVDDNIVDSKIENNRNENSVDKLDNRQQIEDIDKLDNIQLEDSSIDNIVPEVDINLVEESRNIYSNPQSVFENRFINTGIFVRSAGAINDIYRRIYSALQRKFQEFSINYFDLTHINNDNIISTSMKQYIDTLKKLEKERKEFEQAKDKIKYSDHIIAI